MFDRRRFLKTLGAVAVSTSSPSFAAAPSGSPFSLGVASGYPTPSGVVLWTRIGSPAVVAWQVAADEAMRSIVRSGQVAAAASWGHSVHVEVQGLQPERWYGYRFRRGARGTGSGRRRPTPGPGRPPGRARFASGSCQQYGQGWFSAYRHIVAGTPDLVAFLGDYICESTWGGEHVRKHDAGEPWTL